MRVIILPRVWNILQRMKIYAELIGNYKSYGIKSPQDNKNCGCSEIAASNLACQYCFHKSSYNIVAAYDEKYVVQTLSKVWQELDFLNTSTEGAFRRVRMKVDTAFKKRASVVDQDGNESGWMSTIEGVTVDNPRKLRGNRVNTLYFEEAGSNPKLIDTYTQSAALVDILGYRVGSRIAFGTGGDNGAPLAGLKSMFYNPEDYTILPYKHNYTRTGESTFSGYFIPSYTLWFGTKEQKGFDSRGVVDEERAKAYYKARWDRIKDASLLMKDKAEFCFTPEDAFVMEGSNAFNMEKLAEQQMNIDNKLTEAPKNIRLRWGLKDGQVDRTSTPVADYGIGGHIRIVEPPILDEEGIPYNNLYVAGIDSIDTSSDTTTGQTDLSQFCIIVYRRQFGLKDPKIVALYKFRPKQISEAYDEALKLCQYYNCKALVEATRVGIIEYFKRLNMTHYLMRKPRSVTSGRNSNQYGSPATQTVIENNLQLINDYVENFWTCINYPEVIDELTRYSYENKRKFDIVAAFGFALMADQEMANKVPKPQQNKEAKEITQLGYFRNEYGQIAFGVKPKSIENYGGLNYYGRFTFGSQNPQMY